MGLLLAPRQERVVPPGDDEGSPEGEDRRHPLQGPLEEGALVADPGELLRDFEAVEGARQAGESSPVPSREHDGPRVRSIVGAYGRHLAGTSGRSSADLDARPRTQVSGPRAGAPLSLRPQEPDARPERTGGAETGAAGGARATRGLAPQGCFRAEASAGPAGARRSR